MDDFFSILSDDEKKIFSSIAECAFRMGYKAQKDKVKAVGYTFVHRKVKKQILRFTSARGKPILRIKFFATPNYSKFFQEAIRIAIEEYNYRGTGCYGCGDCDGTHGYHYEYPDGRKYYRCGKELIEIYDVRTMPVKELISLLQKQHEYFLSSKPVLG